MQSLLRFGFVLAICFLMLNTSISEAQIFCKSNGNVIIYSNYDGGYLKINIDQNIPNIKIGVTTYEDCEVSITGTYASNVTEVIYAGYQGNNMHCNPSPTTTSVIGVNPNIVTVLQYPPVTLPNPFGYPYIICNYQCDSNSYQGGCNTTDQISHYYLTAFGGSLYYHYTKYGCWAGTYSVSAGGNCCIGEDIIAPTNTPQSAFSVSDATICQKFCINYFDLSENNPTTWQWTFEGGNPSTSNSQNPVQICYNDAGTYDVTLITSNAFGNDTLTLTDYITIYPTPAPPVITPDGNLLTCSAANSYQWQLNSVDIPGATNQSYTATETGFYTVVITDINGCKSSITIYYEITGINFSESLIPLILNSNLSSGHFVLTLHAIEFNDLELTIINLLGREVFKSQIYGSTDKVEFDVSHLPPSPYLLQLKSNNKMIGNKMMFIAR